MKIEYISWPLTTHKLPKKHYEARLSERLPTYPLSQIDYRHTGYSQAWVTVKIAKRFA